MSPDLNPEELDFDIHRRLADEFALDVIALMRQVDDEERAVYLEEMLKYDGADIEGCVTSLATHGLVTQEWVDRLTRMNFENDYDEELEELKEYVDQPPHRFC